MDMLPNFDDEIVCLDPEKNNIYAYLGDSDYGCCAEKLEEVFGNPTAYSGIEESNRVSRKSEKSNQVSRKSEESNRVSRKSEESNRVSRKSEESNRVSRKSEESNRVSRKNGKSNRALRKNGDSKNTERPTESPKLPEHSTQSSYKSRLKNGDWFHEYKSLSNISDSDTDHNENVLDDQKTKVDLMNLLQNIANLQNIGETASLSDWETYKNQEEITIAMMNYCGLDRGDDYLLPHDFDQNKVSPTRDIEYMKFGKHGAVPLFLNSKYFEPRSREVMESFEDVIDWEKYTNPNGTLKINKLKQKLEEHLPLWKRIARLNNLPEDPLMSTNETPQTSGSIEPKIPWSERNKKGSKAFHMAVEAILKDENKSDEEVKK